MGVYRQVAPELGRGYVLPSAALDRPDEDCQTAADAFCSNGRFADVAIAAFDHRVDYTTAQWLDQLPTHSDHRTLAGNQLAAVLAAVGAEIDRGGGHFEMRYTTWLVEARTDAAPGGCASPGPGC